MHRMLVTSARGCATVVCPDGLERQLREYGDPPLHLVSWAVLEALDPALPGSERIPGHAELQTLLFGDNPSPGIQDVGDMRPSDGDPAVYDVFPEYPGVISLCSVRLLDHPEA